MLEKQSVKESLEQLGEAEIIKRLSGFATKGQFDDDTADIKSETNNILINTDLLVEGVHFSIQTTNPFDIGWKAVAANVSDLLGSGTDQILGITVGLVTPPETEWEWVEETYKGIHAALKNFGGELLGGDCSKGMQKILSVTAMGTFSSLRLHRAEAKPGDHLIATGPHGLSRLGLAILQKDAKLDNITISNSLRERAIVAHQRPQPPMEALKILKQCKPENIAWRAGGTDSSDGLIEAILGICRSSNCQAILDPKSLPKTKDWPKGDLWENWCGNGGEDFEIIVSLPPAWANPFLKKHTSSKLIGRMVSGKPKIIWEDKSNFIDLKSDFKHF